MKIEPSKDLKDKVIDLCITINKINRNKIVDADVSFVANPTFMRTKTIKVTVMEEGADCEITEHVLLLACHKLKK